MPKQLAGGKVVQLLFVVCVVLWSSIVCAQQQTALTDYVNDSVGIKVALGPDWGLFTSAANAPAPLLSNFPATKGDNESPLFLGIHKSQGLFARLLIEAYYGDLNGYAKQFTNSVAERGMRLQSVTMVADKSAMQFEYMHEGLGLYFIERVSLLADSQLLRLGFWGAIAKKSEFNEVVVAGFDSAELRDVQGQLAGYQPVWRDLSARLLATTIEGVGLPLQPTP